MLPATPGRLPAMLWRTPAAALLCLLAAPPGTPAQTRWNVVPKASLAWWQMSPNLNHLWATTCPQEPSWRPGEGRSAGWSISGGVSTSGYGYAAVPDTINVPLYPRWQARPLCTEAVRGQIVVADTVWGRGVRGEVVVRVEALVTGSEERDAFTRRAILQTSRHPEMRFTIDSVVGVTNHADTLRATAVGVFTIREVATPMTAAVTAWPQRGGLRVLGKFRIPAQAMVTEFGLSKYALGLGIGVRIWQDLFMGVDLLLRAERAPARNQDRIPRTGVRAGTRPSSP